MARITVGDREFSYDRLSKNRSETIFEVIIVAKSRSGDVSVRGFELDATARGDLTTGYVEDALADWQADHENLTVQEFVVRETNSCGFGDYVGSVADDEATGAAAGDGGSSDGEEASLYRGGSAPQHRVGFGDVPVDEGEEVEFHVAGPSTSVYGTDTGTVTGVKTGTEDYHVLLIETDSGTKRVREDWLVDGGDDAEDAAAEADE